MLDLRTLPRRVNTALKSLGAGIFCVVMSAAVAMPAAASERMIFEALTQRDGLSQSTVNATYQDSTGFIWLATENGLNRFDGYQIRSYLRNRSDPHALESDFLWAIAEDEQGDLWLASDGAGVIRWHRASDRFETVLPAALLDEEPARRLARDVLRTDDGRVFVATRGAGVLELDAQGRLLREHRERAGLGSDVATSLAMSGADALWVGTDAGLDRLHLDDGALERLDLPQSAEVSSVMEDSRGRLWVGTFEQGLWLRREEQFLALRHDDADVTSLSSDEVRAILEDGAGRIWVATAGGLNLYQETAGGFRRYLHEPDRKFSLNDNRLMSLAEDRSGILWVGTRAGGVSRWNPRSWSLGAHAPSEMRGGWVFAFADAVKGGTWAAVVGAGLMRVDADGQVIDRFTAAQGYPELGPEPVSSLLLDSSEALWIGTMGGGLLRYQPGEAELDRLRHDPADTATLGADGIMCLFEDRDGVIWAGTFGGGLARIDPRNLTVTRFAAGQGDPRQLSGDRATAIAQGVDGRLWIGTDGGGLNVLDPESGVFQHFRYSADDPQSLGSDTIFSLFVQPDGTLWVGTAGGGLARLAPADQAAGRFQSLTTADGLSSNVINGIQSDEQGHLWLSSNNGLMRLDPKSWEIEVFHPEHGLVASEFNFGAHHRGADGRLAFGSLGGYNQFDPAEVLSSSQPPQLVLTGFELFNEPADLGQPYEQLRDVTLKHDQDVLTFEYAALDFAAPSRNRYSVMLDGFDRNWSEPAHHRRSTYTNLDPGHYVFRVRAANADGIWTPEALSVALHVKPAPWATGWAYAAYAALGLGLVVLGFRWRMHELERDSRINQLAFYDRVTGLPNAELFEIRLAESIRQAGEKGERVDVFCLYLGQFRAVRDLLGQAMGERLIGALAARASRMLFSGSESGSRRELARVGERSFIAFCQSAPGEQDALMLARSMATAVGETVDIDDHRLQVSPYVGMASFPDDVMDAKALMRFARTAAGYAARQEQDRLIHYEASMTERARDRLQLEAELRLAIANRELDLHLQGKFDADGRLVGAEALCRWSHAERGAISPAIFVPLAEESGLISELDRWMFQRVASQIADWQQRGLRAVPVAVNASVRSFGSGEIIDILETEVRGSGIEPSMIEVEITETALARELEEVQACLQSIQDLGHCVSLDDFGTGYSSLSYLQKFKVDKVKIDAAFVRDVDTDESQRSLCAAIVALARGLRLTTVSEGIEKQEQLDALAELGCDQFQGYLLHRPQPVAQFETLLESDPQAQSRTRAAD